MASYEYDSQNDKLNRIAGGTLYADCPIGSYIPFGGTAIPTGWLLCNGQAVSRTDYADLFAVIGTAYGSGDGSTTFNIPDLREAVPKGAGLTSKSNNHMDADGLAVGEFLDDRLQDHKHKIYYQGVAIGSGFYAYSVDNQSQTGSSREVQTDTRAGATTEVKSVGSNYIIKAKQIGVPADFASAIEDVIDEKFSYSTSEKKTGRKWIDGKDTYTITFNALLSSDSLDVAHNIANIDKVINTSGFLGSDGSCLPSGLYVSPSYFISMFSDRTQYHIRTVSAYLNLAYNITLEYTKTTD